MTLANPYLQVATPQLQRYLVEHAQDDGRSLVLKNKPIHGVSASIVADQLAGRRKAKTKLRMFYETAGIVYPPSINLEQCSSELTARFKAKLLSKGSATVGKVADLTGGFGIDAYFLSKVSREIHFVDQDASLLEIARHNHALLGVGNIIYHHKAAEEFIKEITAFDFIYIDPSRRSNSRKVFRLSECQPDTIALLPALLNRAKGILIKASPLLDITEALLDLGKVEEIVVVSVDHECRELLFVCSTNGSPDPLITGINLDMEGDERFLFRISEERAAASTFHDPLDYLYEPHAWVLKTGAFKTTGSRYALHKLQVNTHLYTSDKLVEDFPGRIFRVETIKPGTAEMKSKFPEGKANVFVRNYPLKPEELLKKYKLRNGGDNYLIGFSGTKQKFLVAGKRVK